MVTLPRLSGQGRQDFVDIHIGEVVPPMLGAELKAAMSSTGACRRRISGISSSDGSLLTLTMGWVTSSLFATDLPSQRPSDQFRSAPLSARHALTTRKRRNGKLGSPAQAIARCAMQSANPRV